MHGQAIGNTLCRVYVCYSQWRHIGCAASVERRLLSIEFVKMLFLLKPGDTKVEVPGALNLSHLPHGVACHAVRLLRAPRYDR